MIIEALTPAKDNPVLVLSSIKWLVYRPAKWP